LGVGTKPSGNCDVDQTGLVTCVNVPTASNTLSNTILSNLVSDAGISTGSRVQLKQYAPDNIPLLELTLAINQPIPVISGLTNKYNGPVILYFEGDGKQNMGRLENGMFIPVEYGLFNCIDNS
jgi:hypothetical protein